MAASNPHKAGAPSPGKPEIRLCKIVLLCALLGPPANLVKDTRLRAS